MGGCSFRSIAAAVVGLLPGCAASPPAFPSGSTDAGGSSSTSAPAASETSTGRDAATDTGASTAVDTSGSVAPGESTSTTGDGSSGGGGSSDGGTSTTGGSDSTTGMVIDDYPPCGPDEGCPDESSCVPFIAGGADVGTVCGPFCNANDDCPEPSAGNAMPDCAVLTNTCVLNCTAPGTSCPDGMTCVSSQGSALVCVWPADP